MPVHDWECASCGAQILDRYQPRLDDKPPECPNIDVSCFGATIVSTDEHKMVRLWTTSNDVKFREFEVDVPGLGHRRIADIQQLRRVEKEAAAAGRPWAIRQYTNDRSNREHNVFRHLQPDQRIPKIMRRGQRVVTSGRGEGPGRD